jgi:hypothetical protein
MPSSAAIAYERGAPIWIGWSVADAVVLGR